MKTKFAIHCFSVFLCRNTAIQTPYHHPHMKKSEALRSLCGVAFTNVSVEPENRKEKVCDNARNAKPMTPSTTQQKKKRKKESTEYANSQVVVKWGYSPPHPETFTRKSNRLTAPSIATAPSLCCSYCFTYKTESQIRCER